MSDHSMAALALFVMLAPPAAAQTDLVDAIKNLDARVYAPKSAEAKELQQQLGKWLRGQRDQVNRRDVQAWDAIRTKEDWEHFRKQKIDALRRSLGSAVAFSPGSKNRGGPAVHITNTIPGDGFVIDNLVYESQPDLWVTANLYRPDKIGGSHPGILVIHSHHNPKTQGELQDMGMTWARAGCYVLIPDQLGHGERRQHPFVNEKCYPGPFRVGRQDYHFRYNVAMHLHLIGESLIGWMANDMMRGVDLLYAKPGIDKKAIILLGSVAGGGDPAGVTAALDPRVTCVVPFNFGGPQPETRFPLPADARLSFNYMGGGSWESTRGLRLAGRDGFLPWVIVGSVAPRALIHAHEFKWDQERDPVWARYGQIFKLYGAGDKLSFSKGAGAVTGSGPGNTHCNNIGVVHRKAIHPMFEKWFGIKATEYSMRLPSEKLQCLTPEVKAKIKLTPVHELVGRMADEDVQAFRKQVRGKPPENQRAELARRWKQLAGMPDLGRAVLTYDKDRTLPDGTTTLLGLITTNEIRVPLLKLLPAQRQGGAAVVIAVAQEGKAAFLKNRGDAIARLLRDGVTIVLPDLPGCGEAANPGEGRGRTSGSTSTSATAQMLGTTIFGLRLRCLGHVIDHVGAFDKKAPIILWGDSFAPVNAADTRFEAPYDVDKMPRLAEPTGPMLALVAGVVFDAPIQAIYTRGGLVSFRSLLDSRFIYVPHDAAIPGALLAGDLDDLAALYLVRKGTRLAIEAPVDGLNRALGQAAIESAYASALKARGVDAGRLRLSAQPSAAADVAAWLRGAK
ncbi:MAG: hypothetical protein L0Y71_11275 [Gemmataceae bacterium]|nr:hypothetical protein [Gemmataceae bacterium]